MTAPPAFCDSCFSSNTSPCSPLPLHRPFFGRPRADRRARRIDTSVAPTPAWRTLLPSPPEDFSLPASKRAGFHRKSSRSSDEVDVRARGAVVAAQVTLTDNGPFSSSRYCKAMSSLRGKCAGAGCNRAASVLASRARASPASFMWAITGPETPDICLSARPARCGGSGRVETCSRRPPLRTGTRRDRSIRPLRGCTPRHKLRRLHPFTEVPR